MVVVYDGCVNDVMPVRYLVAENSRGKFVETDQVPASEVIGL